MNSSQLHSYKKKEIVKKLLFTIFTSRPVARGSATHYPISGKRSTFSHEVGQKLGFRTRVKEGELQKVHFLGPKGPLLGVPHLPKIDPGYGPVY